MSGSVNKVILIGNVGKDPEVRSLNNGGKVVTLSVATSETWKDKQTGERKEKTEWHRVVIFNDGLAGIAEKYVHKGSKIYVEGKLVTRKWTDNNNNERYSTEITLENFGGTLTLLDSPGGNQGGGTQNNSQGNSQSRSQQQDLDDEIPF